MSSLLLVIDLQKDFINSNTESVVDKINKILCTNKFDKVIFTKFINSIDSIYSKYLNYKGCINEESRRIVIDTKGNNILEKTTYTAFGNELKNYIIENNIGKIFLCGIDTECCILKTAFDLFENGYDIYVLKDYCACSKGVERHNNALDILRRNIGHNKVI